MNLPITRAEAKATGAKRYFHGRPCQRGHVSVRRTTDANCMQCVEFHRSRPEYKRKLCERAAAWAKANPEKAHARYRAWKDANPEKYSATKSAWRERNIEKSRESARRSVAKRLRENPHIRRANEAVRRARITAATLKIKSSKPILDFYRKCPPGMHVDHVIPLKSDVVCGLHVLCNLQYLSPFDNVSKNNKFTPYVVEAESC